MKWSKLKKTIEDKFSGSIKGRVYLFATRYTTGSYYMVRGWITIDGEEIANFSTPDNNNKFGWNTPDIDERIPAEDRKEGLAVEKGEFSRWDFMNACWEYINLSIDDAIKSDNPIIKSFAVLDKRLGKRRLRLIEKSSLHPLTLRLLELRLESEKLKVKS
ncbi:MAG: hypothetical protein IPL53_05490 [Ignavibacteria bacterium]|nr:hypothetical protein [Ignavibacteria bacterium]